jgi:hypothetical protein
MGMFNTYDGVQLKNSESLTLRNFKKGQKCDLKDGLYLGPEGFVVINNGRVLRSYDCVTTSHGDVIQGENAYFDGIGTIGKIKDIVGD